MPAVDWVLSNGLIERNNPQDGLIPETSNRRINK
jgi:hypothetical protein